jgi:hypothetical protein
VDTTKVVVHVMQRDRQCVIFELFRECVGKSRKTSRLHSQRKVLTFGIASRNVLGIGIAFDAMFDRADALRRAVSLLAGGVGTG